MSDTGAWIGWGASMVILFLSDGAMAVFWLIMCLFWSLIIWATDEEEQGHPTLDEFG